MDRRSGTAGDAAGEAAPDARLVLPALATWVGAFAGTGCPSVWSKGLGAGALVLLAVALVTSRRRRYLPGAARTATAALLCFAAALAVGAVHRSALDLGEVQHLVAQRPSVSGVVTLTGDPRRATSQARASGARSAMFVVAARLDHLVVRGRAVGTSAPVVLLAEDASWAWLLPGQRAAVSGRLGPARPGQSVSAVLSVPGPPQMIGTAPPLQRAAGELRSGLRRAASGLGRAERGLLPGLVVGDTSRLPAELQEEFRVAGLTHLTAVSGANLAIVTGFVLVVARRVGIRGRWLPFLAAVAMVGFVVLARPQPSVLRAGAMGAIALAALATGRRRRSIAALGATAIVLLLWDPWLSRSYGFALSVLATGGLVVLAPGWASRLHGRGLPIFLAQALAVPLAAQLVCAPVVAMLSGQVSLVAVPANLLAGPAVAPATVLGVLATVASGASDGVARRLAEAASFFVSWIVLVARRAADVPLATVGWPGRVAGAAVLAVLTVLALLAARPLARRPLLAAAVTCLLAVALVVPASRPGWPPQGWLLAACDVGQGDALVLAAGRGRAVVVDAGPEPAAVNRCLRDLGVTRVPLVMLTHLHADHVEGLPGVLRRRDVGEVRVGPYGEPADELSRVRAWAASSGVPLTRASVGERGRLGPLRWVVVWPARVIEAGSVPNNASTVLLVRTHGVTILLTGDIEPEAQHALLARARLSAVDVLKVPHHGSANQAPELLAAVRPRVALVSAGVGNDYGHPARATLDALSRAGSVVGRTDLAGTLVIAGSAGSLRLVAAGSTGGPGARSAGAG